MNDFIYFDNAATTRQDSRVTEVMINYMESEYGNASAQYSIGFNAKRALNQAREYASNLINADMDEIIFTSGGTESDNHALNIMTNFEKGKSLVTTSVEHPAVLNTCKRLEKLGYVVKYVKPDKYGFCSAKSIEEAIDGSTVLISVMMANNEVGTVMPIAEIADIAHKNGCLFHTDAVQCFGIENIDVKSMHIDMLSASSHKLYGPKGAGLLYVKRGIKLPCFIQGGGQEYGNRSGTENVPAIVGFGEACRIAKEEFESRRNHEYIVSKYIAERVLKEIPDSCLNGADIYDGANRHEEGNSFGNNVPFKESGVPGRLPGNLHFSFFGVNGNSLRILLDMKKICVSTGSACSASSKKHSHVLDAMDMDLKLIDGSLRITVGKYNTLEEADKLIETLKSSVESIRTLTNYGK